MKMACANAHALPASVRLVSCIALLDGAVHSHCSGPAPPFSSATPLIRTRRPRAHSNMLAPDRPENLYGPLPAGTDPRTKAVLPTLTGHSDLPARSARAFAPPRRAQRHTRKRPSTLQDGAEGRAAISLMASKTYQCP